MEQAYAVAAPQAVVVVGDAVAAADRIDYVWTGLGNLGAQANLGGRIAHPRWWLTV